MTDGIEDRLLPQIFENIVMETIMESLIAEEKAKNLTGQESEESDDDEIKPTIAQIVAELITNFNDTSNLNRLMIKHGFLRNVQYCKKCQKRMGLRKRRETHEWRCRRPNKTDCSVCSIKIGSWFENSKLPFSSVFSFLLMHSKNESSASIRAELNLTTHTIIEFRKTVFALSTRIASRYPAIGGIGKRVEIEEIAVTTKRTCAKVVALPNFKLIAGQVVGSNQCFARLIDEESSYESPSSIVNLYVLGGSEVTIRRSTDEMDEKPGTIFHSVKQPTADSCALSNELIQDYLNDLVVRITEGENYLFACCDEIRKGVYY